MSSQSMPWALAPSLMGVSVYYSASLEGTLLQHYGDCQVVSPQLAMSFEGCDLIVADTTPFIARVNKLNIEFCRRLPKSFRVFFQPKVDKTV